MLRTLSIDIRFWSVQYQCNRGKLSRALQTSASQASTAAETQTPNSFPYPSHRNPTPHQLFHLPHNATESDIKARYFDLVRLYHPDKIGVSTSSDLAHARFQEITAAYEILRRKSSAPDDPLSSTSPASPRYRTTAAYRAMRKKRQELYNSGPVDDSRKDKFIIFGVIMTIVIVLAQTASVRREVLSESLSRHRQAVQNIHSTRREEDRLSQDHPQKSDTS
ncbi:hypothetical protein HYPSUDRAFT_35019 [Hypholoma sublateritium FD-334 SS-4]|uniref:J domain-containing protein n=1 Tax=Hypholoma sublateritium (strain FD-334 SS-4) TaxID=945553 RepID=A0A0D2Q7Z2_HYPSF|nr:hypothetical protein HYPSUDRAFT_35019 [Hypholoma sublateritium FD-334 SS-4]